MSGKNQSKAKQNQKPVRAAAPKTITPAGNNRKWLPYLVLALMTIFVYSMSFNTEFIYNWDDAGYVTGSKYVKSLDGENLKAIFHDIDYMSNYHPLTTLSYAIDWAIAGENPVWYHIVNLLFHLMNAMLVFLVIKRMFRTKSDWVPFFVAMIFAVHPMHVESVAWISERKDVMYTFFFLLATLTYHKYCETTSGKWKPYLLTVLLFLLALMSKSAAVVFPVVLFAFDWYRRRKFGLWMVLEKVPMLVLSFIFGVIALKSQTEAMQNLAPLLTMTERLQIVNHSFLTYIYKFFLPINLSGYYPYPIKDNGILPSIYNIAPFITVGLLGLFIWFGRKSRELVFGVVFFVINLGLVLQLKPVGGAVLAERYTYVPYIGLALPLAFWLGNNADRNKLMQLIILAAGIIFAAMSFNRVPVWKSGDALFTNVLEQFPRNPYAWDNRGGLYWDIYASKKYKDNPAKKQLYTDKAYHDYSMSLQLDASFVQPWAHRGILLFNINKYEEALSDFNEALKLKPDYVDALIGRANTLSTLQKYKEALPDYDAYLKLKNDDAAAYVWRATAYSHLQQYDKAMADCDAALKLDPQNAEAWYWKGLSYYNTGKNEEAIANFTKATEIKPDYQEVLVWQGMAHANLKQYSKAVETYSRALQLKPNDAVALVNRSVAYYNQNDFGHAIADLDAAGNLGYPLNKDYYMAVKTGDRRFQSK
ncbi:hypothetical protein SDC9_66270 [bioreactor metagenome]|uniref:Photosystem I assembly protein Ycf3 n=1 Tax=bioreactor metagenome TaxID=1076179 RepID=A0A644Y003_9ZZZZ